MNTEVEVVEGDRWPSLFDDWSALQAEHPNPFLSFEWFDAWRHAYAGDGRRVFAVVVRRDGDVIGIVPLEIEATSVARTVRLASVRDLYPDHMAPVAAAGDLATVCAATLDHLVDGVSGWDALSWGDLTEAAAEAMAEACRSHGPVETGPCTVCPFVALEGSFDDYLKSSFKQKKRYNLRRQVRIALEDQGLEIVEADATGLASWTDHFFRLHEARAQEKGIESSITSEPFEAFFRDFNARALEREWLRMRFLVSDGTPVACACQYECGGRVWYYQTGVDPEWSRFSLGTVLLTGLLEQAFRDGHAEFDFLQGNESYKNTWMTGERANHHVTFYRGTIRGATARSLSSLKSRVKGVIR